MRFATPHDLAERIEISPRRNDGAPAADDRFEQNPRDRRVVAHRVVDRCGALERTTRESFPPRAAGSNRPGERGAIRGTGDIGKRNVFASLNARVRVVPPWYDRPTVSNLPPRSAKCAFTAISFASAPPVAREQTCTVGGANFNSVSASSVASSVGNQGAANVESFDWRSMAARISGRCQPVLTTP